MNRPLEVCAMLRGLLTEGWNVVGKKLSKILEDVVSVFADELDKVLNGLAQKEYVTHVPEGVVRCCEVNWSDVSD